MDAQHYTGSDEELQVILEGAPGPAGLFPHALDMRLADWRDAAVARRLSEAGAVYPAVQQKQIEALRQRVEELERQAGP